jgi:hypothetical protein
MEQFFRRGPRFRQSCPVRAGSNGEDRGTLLRANKKTVRWTASTKAALASLYMRLVRSTGTDSESEGALAQLARLLLGGIIRTQHRNTRSA